MRPATGSAEDHGDVALGDGLALLDQDLPDDPGLWRQQWDLHLHRFEDHQRIVLGDLVADRHLDLPHRSGDLAPDPQFGHVLPAALVRHPPNPALTLTRMPSRL